MYSVNGSRRGVGSVSCDPQGEGREQNFSTEDEVLTLGHALSQALDFRDVQGLEPASAPYASAPAAYNSSLPVSAPYASAQAAYNSSLPASAPYASVPAPSPYASAPAPAPYASVPAPSPYASALVPSPVPPSMGGVYDQSVVGLGQQQLPYSPVQSSLVQVRHASCSGVSGGGC